MAVRRVLNQRKLRSEMANAKKALRHSQSLYRALADNPTYGIYRCDADGELLDVNLALIAMLVLPETNAGAARLVGQRIRELLAKDSEEPALSVSVGAAGYPSDASTIGTLLYAADRALYEMKELSTGTADALRNFQQLLPDAAPGVLPTTEWFRNQLGDVCGIEHLFRDNQPILVRARNS